MLEALTKKTPPTYMYMYLAHFSEAITDCGHSPNKEEDTRV